MSELAGKAIDAVINSSSTYCKFLSASDSRVTKGHQAGILISVTAKDMLFADVVTDEPIQKFITRISWQDRYPTDCTFTWYKSKKRNEIIVSGFGREIDFSGSDYSGALFILIKNRSSEFNSYILTSEDDIVLFINEVSARCSNTIFYGEFPRLEDLDKERVKKEYREKQRALIEYVLTKIAPFNPETMNEKLVYARVENIADLMDEEERNESKQHLFLELLTEECIDTNYRYFVDESMSYYKTFGYSFTVSGNADDSAKRTCELLNEHKEGWIKGTLKRLDQIENVEDGKRAIRGHLSFVFCLENTRRISKQVPFEIDAAFVFDKDLSTANDNQTELIAKTDTVIKNTLSGSNDQTIDIGTPTDSSSDQGSGSNGDSKGGNNQGVGNSSSNSSNTLTKISVYKVGHGNAITIEANGKCILFDYGGPTNFSNYAATSNHIVGHVKPDIVIVSHWHTDHYNKLSGIDDSNLKLFIHPQGLSASSFSSIAAAWRSKGVRFIEVTSLNVSNYQQLLCAQGFSGLELFLGEGKQDPGPGTKGHIDYTRSKDDTGIILALKAGNRDKYLILPGDCSYYSWPQNLKSIADKIEQLILPHHGGCVIVWDDANISNCKKAYMSSESQLFFDWLYDSCVQKATHPTCRASCTDINTCTYHRSFIERSSGVQIKLTQCKSDTPFPSYTFGF